MRQLVTKTAKATNLKQWPKELKSISTDKPEAPKKVVEPVGYKKLDSYLKQVLHTVWTCEVTTKSDFARENADYIAMASSMGLISTRIMSNVYGRNWQVTAKGLDALEKHYGIKTSQDEDHDQDQQHALPL